jgi:RNA polymerase sigma factor (sigma-70 family)
MSASSSAIHDYLSSIARLPVLTKEAQLLHCRNIHTHVHWPTGPENAPRNIQRRGRRSMRMMVETNTRLVVSVAKKYQNRGLDLADLIQEGSLGLIRGLELYDPARGYALSTYVYWWIRQAVSRAIHTQARMIRLPINSHEILGQITSCVSAFTTEHGRAPTLPEIAATIKRPEARIRELIEQATMTACLSLDVSILDDDTTMLSNIANPTENVANDPDIALTQATEAELIHQAIDHLHPPEAIIVRSLYIEQTPMTNLAVTLGSNRAKINQTKCSALIKMRRYIKSAEFQM